MLGVVKPLRGYYAILDISEGSNVDVEAARARARRLITARPCCLQLRAKTASAAELLALGRVVLSVARAGDVPLCINDRLDVALLLGADAVHLGQDDLPLGDARKVAAAAAVTGRQLAIGVSTHDRAQAEAAIAQGADYIGYGPVFPTTTKRNPDAVVGLGGLAEICGLGATPVIAIGGLSISRMGEVAEAGAAGAALIAAMEEAADPVRAGALINAAFGILPAR
jgi:thiamine-phosphate pyrophosphorylase